MNAPASLRGLASRRPGVRQDAGVHLGAALVFVGATAAAQQPCLLQVDGAVHGVQVRGDAEFAAAGHSVQAMLPTGEWRLAFGAGGGGRPAGVDLVAPSGGTVVVAVAPPPAPLRQPWVAADGEATEPSVHGEPDVRDVRVAATVTVPADGPPAGVCVRWQGPEQHYRFVLDPRAEVARLERQLGSHVFVLATAPLAATGTGPGPHRLELQVEGFRLHAFVDGRSVARAMDGAISEGRFGTFAVENGGARFSRVLAAPPAEPLATTAAIASAGALEVRARAPLAVGHQFALGLRLDQPEPLWPQRPSGCEPFVLQPPAEPWLLFGFAFGQVDADGNLDGALRWPLRAGLLGRAALVGGLLGSPDGSIVTGRLPWAAVRF